MKRVITALLWATISFLSAQPVTRVMPDSLNHGIAIKKMDFVRDKTGKLPFESVRDLEWAPLDWSARFSLAPWEWQWLRFELENTSPQDSLDAVLIAPHAYWMSFWTKTSDTIFYQQSGVFNNLNNRPFRAHPLATTVHLPPGGRAKYWLGLKTYENKKIDSIVLWLKTREMALAELRNERGSVAIHTGHYLLVFLFMGVVFSILYFTTYDRATGWYTLYVWGFVLLYLCKYDLMPGEPSFWAHFREWGLHVEILTLLMMFVAYTGFVRYFLDVGEKNPLLDRYLRAAMLVFAFCVPFEMALFAWGGLKMGFQFFTLVCIAGGVAFCATFFMGIGRLRSKYARFVLIGMCLLLAPAMFTKLIVQHVGGAGYDWINGVLRVHEVRGVPIPMYSAKVGIVLELLCFAFAIGYKWREEKETRDQELLSYRQIESELQAKSAALTTERALNRLTAPVQTEKAPSDLISAVIAAIEKNMEDPLFGVEQLARTVHVSRAKLHRRVTEETGRTPSQLILEERLKKAVVLLRATRTGIAEIALATGFSEPGYFSKVFKKELGKTPKEVRDGA